MSKDETMNPIMRNMIKSFLPMLKKKLPEFEGYLRNYISGIELHGKETRAGIVISNGTDNVFILIAAFDDNDTVIRIIQQLPAVEFLEPLLKQI